MIRNLVAWNKILYGSDSRADSWPHKFEFWEHNATELGYTLHLPAMMSENAAHFLEKGE